jgi:hypothetical protein
VITKALFSAAITLGVVVAAATPANADPSAFGALSCSCEQLLTVPAPDDIGAPPDAVDQGIQSGLAELVDFQGAQNS